MLNHTLYQIEEFSDIWADACLRDSEGRLMFLSVYGRDGVLMQMLAAFELGASQRGVNQIHLVGKDGERHRVDVGDVKRLDKHAGKLPRQNLFGPLNQMWLFDRGMRSPDRANRIGWALHSSSAARRSAEQAEDYRHRLWQLVNLLSPVALQEHWREPVFQWCREKQAIQALDSRLYPALGNMTAMRVSLSDHFTTFISSSVRMGVLRLEEGGAALQASLGHQSVEASRIQEAIAA